MLAEKIVIVVAIDANIWSSSFSTLRFQIYDPISSPKPRN